MTVEQPVPWTKELITQTVSRVTLPDGSTLHNAVEWAAVCENYLSLKLHTPQFTQPHERGLAAAACRRALDSLSTEVGAPIQSLIVEFVDHLGTVIQTVRFQDQPTPPATPKPTPPPPAGHRPISGLEHPKPDSPPLRNIRHVIAVGAGKGGVGKSTIAVNLAVGLARRGFAVGILDGDIYGPSLPTLLRLGPLEQVVHAGRLQPFLVHGVKAITLGKLVEADRPLIWRGPMAHGAFKQLTEQTEWGNLDYLIIDLPPGTGDVPLTMAQMLQLSGAVVVCTPQRVAQDDAIRATRMFQQLGIEILGVVENMSYFIGDDGKTYDIFGRGGAEQMAQRLGVPFLGAVPITMSLRENGDAGSPTANFEGNTDLARALEGVITQVEHQTTLAAMRSGNRKPSLTIS
ncbi:MAG: Mrp/NBP35 family ATP-binding protein [Phycisphaeraceae bacterium]|nr:Mrp/NBP35 family ATP-binding protein [Phycisphaeraceae bacterium]MCW5754812.1 Mrp/NBP35 family ATP-binding protein [Phycisphaeraceae bacterium]